MIRKCFYLLCSALVSAGLIISIPLITILFTEGLSRKDARAVRKTEVQRMALPQPKPQKPRERTRPRRRLSPRTTPSSGPRFAMALGAQGVDGVGVKLDMLKAGATQAGIDDEGVDQRPRLQGELQVKVPDAVRNAEVNARVRLLFCVDVAGRPYDIRISEEEPAGIGLAQAAREALSRTVFSPAMQAGEAVSFCGMEQPVEIRFRN